MKETRKKDHFKPTDRFSIRVDNYLKYRPHYPKEIVERLEKLDILKKNMIIADIGSGTGLLSEIFLRKGYEVIGIEPNNEMRKGGEKYLERYHNFTSINGTAENTILSENSVDFITIGQAFHWFDHKKSKLEFQRILKPRGYVAIIYNSRKKKESPFLAAYEELLRKHSTDYHKVSAIEKNYDEFFGKNGFKEINFGNYQDFDFPGLKGRLLSSSYAIPENQPGHEEMIEDLEMIFNAHKINEKVKFEYITRVIYGKIE